MSFLLVLSFAVTSWSQKCDDYGHLEEGNSWTLTQYNKRGKETGATDYKVLSKKTVDGNVEWEIQTVIKDKKDEEMSDVTATAICDGETIRLDMSQFMNSTAMESMEGMNMEIDAGEVIYPFEMTEETDLPDASITIKAKSGGMTLVEIKTTVFDRKVLGLEEITTPAGTFQAYKISQSTRVENRILNMETSSIDWYVPGFTVVRSEYFNKRGKEDGYSEITEFIKM